jgi:hypothetical protein
MQPTAQLIYQVIFSTRHPMQLPTMMRHRSQQRIPAQMFSTVL